MNPVSPSTGQTSSVVPLTAVTTTWVPRGDRSVGAADREPPLARQAHVSGPVGISDDVEGQHLLADERAVDAATEPAVVALVQAFADMGPNDDDADRRRNDRHRDLKGDRRGGDERDHRCGKGTDRPEEGVEGEMVDLEGQKDDPEDQPHDDHTAPLFTADATATRSNHRPMLHGPRLCRPTSS